MLLTLLKSIHSRQLLILTYRSRAHKHSSGTPGSIGGNRRQEPRRCIQNQNKICNEAYAPTANKRPNCKISEQHGATLAAVNEAALTGPDPAPRDG